MSLVETLSKIFSGAMNAYVSPMDNFNDFSSVMCSTSYVSGSPLQSSAENVGLALMVSLGILLIIYMFNAYKRDQKKVEFVKMELYELFISALIGVSILSVTFAECDITMSSISPLSGSSIEGKTIYEATSIYFDESISLLKIYNFFTYLAGSLLDLRAGTTSTARPLSFGAAAKVFAGAYTPIKQLAYNGFVFTMIFLLALYVFKIILFLGAYVSLVYLIPFGVFLRSFTPTRNYGGAILGLCFGFLIILPLMYAITTEILYGKTTSGTYGMGSLGSIRESLVSGFVSSFYDSSNTNNPITSGSSFEDLTWAFLKNYIGEMLDDIKSGINDLLKGDVPGAAHNFFMQKVDRIVGLIFIFVGMFWQAVLVSLILPLLYFFLFGEAVKFVSHSLGGEIDVMAITRLI